jgi:DNA-binding NarL/FixJ family response regulator
MTKDRYLKEKVLATGLMILIGFLVTLDAWSDYRQGGSLRHIMSELVVVFLAVGGSISLWSSSLTSLRQRLDQAEADQRQLQVEAAAWKQNVADLAAGLSVMIDRQFDVWGLSAAEKEVALLLLKGLSIRDIADLRQVSERTVKQQNMAIYRKSQLQGRAELAAFFLEDLLVTPHPPPPS